MPEPRTKTQREMASMPDNFDILVAGSSTEGRWSAIKVWNADFANNVTSIEVSGTGKNLYALNAVLSDGEEILGAFTKIVIAGGSSMVILAYRGQ